MAAGTLVYLLRKGCMYIVAFGRLLVTYLVLYPITLLPCVGMYKSGGRLVTLLTCALEYQALRLPGLRVHLFTRREKLSPIHSSKKA